MPRIIDNLLKLPSQVLLEGKDVRSLRRYGLFHSIDLLQTGAPLPLPASRARHFDGRLTHCAKRSTPRHTPSKPGAPFRRSPSPPSTANNLIRPTPAARWSASRFSTADIRARSRIYEYDIDRDYELHTNDQFLGRKPVFRTHFVGG